jgi:hypothetical protein
MMAVTALHQTEHDVHVFNIGRSILKQRVKKLQDKIAFHLQVCVI